MADLSIHFGDNLQVCSRFGDAGFDLIYIDPPFNTGKRQERQKVGYADSFADYRSFLLPRLQEAHRLLKEDGSLFVHLDYRECHYVKIWLDELFGRDCFQNEIIWAYDYGARTKKRWSAKHDNILWYSKSPKQYKYDVEQCERIPYMAPGLVGKEKAARGKTPTDTWWHTIVPTNGKEKTGYPTQKPVALLERIVKVHSVSGDKLLDFFAGSGTFGEAAIRNHRSCVLIDNNQQALDVMERRFKGRNACFHFG
jgi:site-specific DNA-methyltransferase (adenine-specific)